MNGDAQLRRLKYRYAYAKVDEEIECYEEEVMMRVREGLEDKMESSALGRKPCLLSLANGADVQLSNVEGTNPASPRCTSQHQRQHQLHARWAVTGGTTK
jgi:hypothetical protein